MVDTMREAHMFDTTDIDDRLFLRHATTFNIVQLLEYSINDD